ncbi:DUF4054 domain-containing protein [Dyella mobilis]|uniref:DUF4054 domain-containing protein n=1 Tax=Dyella mobilis TaxID=1849582 RepID=A0ABS2KMD7_9GAMM|nr:DUF4054 domain-containing protein [Dyella mobilis]MBM7131558.1 DUF4054 domain-containing protein [Dyella mobilis]GLQ96471.1 hypothetical protein GCM10007863_08890 [Dyella mobilis]
MDPTQFVTDFPEFANSTMYPTTVIAFQIGIATQLLNAQRWGSMLNYGIELYVAHNLVLAAQAAEDSALGNTPGEMTGPTSAKSVDKVSVSFDTAAAQLADAGYMSLTRYGIQFLQLSRMIGAGGIQLAMC